MLDNTPQTALATLVADLERALIAQDGDAVADLFLETGYWRDLAAFTWNLKTCEGRAQIAAIWARPSQVFRFQVKAARSRQ